MSSHQSASAAERAAHETSAQIRAQTAPAFASLDVKDTFISITVARQEHVPALSTPPAAQIHTGPLELTAYIQQVLDMYQTRREPTPHQPTTAVATAACLP